MEHFKSKMKVLIIVEGQQTELEFFTKLFSVFDVPVELVFVANNLYALYHKMEMYHFECDVKDALAELVNSDEMKEILKSKFTYTYLIFDSDLQNKAPAQRSMNIPIEQLAEENLDKLKEMAGYFTDETDPTIGRLYINYPMMESYRYCDSFYDEAYLSAIIPISMMKDFKKYASQKRLSGYDISTYTKNNFEDLIRMNVHKLKTVSDMECDETPSYQQYQTISVGAKIADNQSEMVLHDQKLSVINTSLFMILDYFGNKHSFYDKFMNLI